MNTSEVTLEFSAQEADFMSNALKSSPETKAKIDELLHAWAVGVLSEEQNAFVENLMSKDSSNMPRIGAGKVLLALSEPAAAVEHAIPVNFSEDDLVRLKPEIEEYLQFIDLISSRERKLLLEDSEREGIPEDDVEIHMDLLNNNSRFGARKRIGERVLQTVNQHIQS